MPKLKKRVDKDFTTIHNKMVRDKNLDIGARGVLVTMLSLPDDWNFSIKGLTAILPDGCTKISTALKNLEKYGYLVRKRIYVDGKIKDWEYIFSDEPMNEHLDPEADSKEKKSKSNTSSQVSTKAKSKDNEEIQQETAHLKLDDLELENLIQENLMLENPLNNQIKNNQILINQSINQSNGIDRRIDLCGEKNQPAEELVKKAVIFEGEYESLNFEYLDSLPHDKLQKVLQLLDRGFYEHYLEHKNKRLACVELSSLYDERFSVEQMQELWVLIQDIPVALVPCYEDPYVGKEWDWRVYHYFDKKLSTMNTRNQETKISNRFKYLKKMVENDIRQVKYS